MTAERVKVSEWGKDHWSTFGYAYLCAVDYKGKLDPTKMRRDGTKYPTRLRGREVVGHNDFDCIEDMEAEGLLENIGTGVNPRVKITDKGHRLVLRFQPGGETMTDYFIRVSLGEKEHMNGMAWVEDQWGHRRDVDLNELELAPSEGWTPQCYAECGGTGFVFNGSLMDDCINCPYRRRDSDNNR
jgi:hypothetical protein